MTWRSEDGTTGNWISGNCMLKIIMTEAAALSWREEDARYIPAGKRKTYSRSGNYFENFWITLGLIY